MNIFESLENLDISEECFNDIVGLVEEYLSEKVTVERVKQAAKNSIENRKQALNNADDDYYRFAGKLAPRDQQTLDKWHDNTRAKWEDKLARAQYLSNNLPDSKMDAKKLFKAAKKVADKRADDSDEQYRKRKEAAGNKELVDKAYFSPNSEEGEKAYAELTKKVGNSNAAHHRARHAAILAGKPAPDDSPEGRREAGNYEFDEVSPKKRNEQLKKDIKTAEKNYDKARSTHIRDKVKGVWDSKHASALDSAVSKLNQAKHNWNQNIRTLKQEWNNA